MKEKIKIATTNQLEYLEEVRHDDTKIIYDLLLYTPAQK